MTSAVPADRQELLAAVARKPRVADVAARAGVSTATVDRVINGRGGVRQRTVTRVEEAIRSIVGIDQPARIADGPLPRFDVILAGDGAQSVKALAEALGDLGAVHGLRLEVDFVELMNPAALAARLRRCIAHDSDGVIVQVLDHALVRDAFDALAQAGIPVVTVLTDIAGADRLAYVGLDNRAAGRTAGFLMGGLCPGPGKLAVVWAGQLYRSHEERDAGFRSYLRNERPELECLEVITGVDKHKVTRARLGEIIAGHTDIVGIYCVGAGVAGAADAVRDAGLERPIAMIAHNFNADTRPYLLSGTIHAVIHQNMTRIATLALDCLRTRQALPGHVGIPIEIVTRENMMYR
ncbi:MAG TPA: LacI family DNA-binding transcriptional regulator [Stellaceae bacterium]|nr:LacI family DNA-binding transcriptional regulator [Stellaceae bacterium]